MAFMKYLAPYSGKEDPEGWLESYESAAKAEKWTITQMLECVGLKLKKKAKDWFSNLTGEAKPKTWEQFLTIFLEEFSTEDHQNTIAKLYLSRQKKGEKLKSYFTRYYKYLKKHETAVKREVAIRYAKAQADKPNKPLIPDPTVIQKEKDTYIKDESNKLLLNEESRVDAFIKGLRSKQYRSHFLITKPSTMEEVRRTVIHITRKGQWIHTTNKKHNSDSSSSSTSSDSESESSSTTSDSDSSMEEDFIRMKSVSSHSKKKHIGTSKKDKGVSNTSNSIATTKQESGEIDSLIKQFGEMKILLAEAVTKVDKLEQNRNSCKNCRSTTHTAPNCTQPCKVCQGSLGVHVFWKCPNYSTGTAGNRGNPNNPASTSTTAIPVGSIEHVLLEDDDDFDLFSNTLEALLAHEETHSKKRVRVEDIEDEDDQVRLVSTTSAPNPTTTGTATTSNSKPAAAKKPARPRKPKSTKEPQDPSPANKAAVQLMGEAKLSLTLQQICDLAPSFRAEVRRILIKPRKAKNSTKTSPENMYLSNTTNGDDSGNCPRTLVKVNNLYNVNSLLDGGAVPNIISLDLVKKLGIKELLKDPGKYTTANGQRSQALGIAQGITIQFMGKMLRFSAIVYNHNAFPLLLGRKALTKLRVITDWDTCKWYMKTDANTKVRIPINFETNYGIRRITVSNSSSEDESEMEEATSYTSDESTTSTVEESSDNEIFVFQENTDSNITQLAETSEGNLRILTSEPEIPTTSISTREEILKAIEISISKVPSKYNQYISELRELCKEFIDIFGISYKDLKISNVLQFDIDTGDAAPIYCKPHSLPYKYKQFAKDELDAAVKAGTMEGPLKELCRWGFPVWVVVKPKTNELRMVGDFRLLNKRTISDEVAIPDMKSTIEQLGGSKVYSLLDFLKAFNQIGNSLRAKERLVVATEHGNYRYLTMPFGPTGAPSTFAKAVCIAFRELLDIVASYFDDATVHSKDPKLHLAHLRRVFEAVRKYNFTLRPDKCLFFQEEAELLGHIVSPSGIKPADKILNKVTIFELPKNKTELKGFIHLCGFYMEHIQSFAEIAAPLTDLLRKNSKFILGSTEIRAWNLLKAQTLKASELAFFNSAYQDRVYTDASDIGIGGVYTQINEQGEERPVKFISRKMTPTEQRYDTVSKELLAITYMLQKLRRYIFGRNFKLFTDSNAVKWLFTKKELSAKHSRYILLLQDYPCEVVHIAGKKNVVADVLSRYPCAEAPIDPQDLDYFPHILAIEASEVVNCYETIFNYVYQYIQTLTFEGIPEEFQRRVHLERQKYFIEKEKLYKRSSHGPLLVPKIADRPSVLKELHDGHGHFALESTFKRARTLYYWPNMYYDIKEDIKHCPICQICEKAPKNPYTLAMWPIFTQYIFQRFGIDFVGPLTETLSGNKFILVMTEYYTRWPMAVATPSADAETTAKVIYREIFCTFGPPAEILSDRGSHFANKTIQNLCKIVEVIHKFSTPYHPQTNGLVESFNGTLVQTLRKLTLKQPTKWDEWIATALYVYRTRVHSTLNITPYEMLYGVAPRNSDPIHFASQLLGEERLLALEDKRDQVHDKFTQRQADKWSPELDYKKGDTVLIKREKKLKIQAP